MEGKDELVIYDGDQMKNTGYYVPFPRELIKNKHTRMAVLTAWMCEEPTAYMNDFSTKLLAGTFLIVLVSVKWRAYLC